MPPQEVSFCERRAMSPEDRQRFFQHFANSRPDQTIGVKRPNLLGNPHSPIWLAEFSPRAKLIAILRNPIERAVSGYFHYMATGLLPIQPIDPGISQILDEQIDRQAYPRAHEVLEFGRYGEQLDRYEKSFSTDQLLVMLTDDVRRDSQAALSRLFDFIGVDASYIPTTIDRRPMQAPYSLTRLRIRRWLYEPTRSRPEGATYFNLKRGPWATCQRAFASFVDRYILKRVFPSGPPKLSTIVGSRLIDYYRDDIARVSKRVEKNLDHWLTPIHSA